MERAKGEHGQGLASAHLGSSSFWFPVLQGLPDKAVSEARERVRAALVASGLAPRLALTDGISRFGPQAKRGGGFRPIFVGLAT